MSFPPLAPPPTALIAEDEPLLARALQQELARAWPELQVLATVGDGAAAVAQALALQPDVLFFDIRMPGMGGLEAATALAEDWPAQGPAARPFPQLVFVTAFDQYALDAFDSQAVDYLLKPVQPEHLQRTVVRLQQGFLAKVRAAPSSLAINFEASIDSTLNRLRALLPPPAAAQGLPRLAVIQASVGHSIHMVPLAEVLVFEASDKYVRVLTADREYLIRTPLKDLLPQLDAQEFWQIHRSTAVRAQAIESVTRDEAGRLSLKLRGRAGPLPVSRLYAHLFKAM